MSKKNKTITAETIITSHINADFDAIASMLAAQKLYPNSIIVFPGSQEKNLRDFFISSTSYLFNMADPGSIDFSQTLRLVIVDTRQTSRLPQVSDLLRKKDIKIDIYDHHPAMEGDLKGSVEITRQTGATITILCSLLQEKKFFPTPEEATIMALGIYEDTGLFTYSSTTREDFEQAAFLLSCGASLSTIAGFVVKEIKSEQVTWLNELLNEMTIHRINGVDIHMSVISSSSYITDLATIVQKIVRMENLDIFFAIVLMGNKIHIIARNLIPEVDVGKILSEFGGGGHPSAASAKVENRTLAQVEMMLIERLQKQVKQIQIVKNMMTSPAITIEPLVTCKTAGSLMTRYNINTLLVVDKQKNYYEGYITRQIIEKILYHKLSHLPVKEYMNSEVSSISSDADVSQIENIIVEGKHRILPVIDDGFIKGVITRTDLLNYLVQHSKEIKRNETELGIKKNAKKRQIENILYQRLDNRIKQLLQNIGKTGNELGFNMFVVGGFVRDLLLSRQIDDIDIVVEGDGIEFAKTYAKKEGCRINTYKKFGTAVIIYPDNFKIDVASARLEYYKTPAALPIVEKSSIKLDLARRDFTINTLAISLNPDNFGTMIDYFGANRDLKDKTIRTIHNLSFVEDPTRIFRAIKFSNRFGFKIGKVTSNLIKNAITIDCFKNLSGLRVLSELKQIFEEENPIPAIKTMESYGLEKVLHKDLTLIPNTYQLLESVNKILSWHDLLYMDEPYPRWAVYFMAMLNRCSYKVCEQICTRLNVPLRERGILLEKRYKAEKQLNLIESSSTYTKQELYWTLINFKTEYILYMMALVKDEEIKKAISNFYTHQRGIKPYIKGRDLLKLGLQPGPVFSAIIKQVLNAKLDGQLKTRKEEIQFAAAYAEKTNLLIKS
ncbi:CBS domain-containing protein [Desulfobacula toluolica]|uniref:Predicted polyA polymerase family protein n=1 Tax=Desulfobacula toluolica (strain DSM 7467 / Tol2) TaxID=651182 RepID=K0N8F0_DESTT|nr:CBS domain-containing protein [Desulfobacula toluolica]CCK80169.1 predicted polyA polymerase family protein [Desulfobacula toluolica Tol2]